MVWGSLSANRQVCVPVLLKVWQEASGTAVCWPLGGAVLSFEVDAFAVDSCHLLMFRRAGSSLMAQRPGYRPLTLRVQVLSLTVAPRFHWTHNTEDKNPKTNGETTLNAKDTQRESHNCKQKRRRKKKKKMKRGVKKIEKLSQ